MDEPIGNYEEKFARQLQSIRSGPEEPEPSSNQGGQGLGGVATGVLVLGYILLRILLSSNR
jgi:hypothetical protein